MTNLDTNLASARTKTKIQDLINRLNNPSLSQDQYRQIRYEFIKMNEGASYQAYRDSVGKITIGVGFNMDRGQEARTEWSAAFGGSISFDDVYNNRVQLNENQVRQLYDYSVSVRESEVSALYKNVNLTPAQRLVVEDMYFNTPSLVNGKIDSNGKYTGTSFFRNLDQYVKTGDQTYLDNVLKEVLENSNKSEGQLLIGLSNRRLKEAAILSGNADIKLPDSEVRQLFEANKNKFDVKIDGKSAKEYFNDQIKNNGLSSNNYLNDNDKFFTSDDPSLLYQLAYNSGSIRSDALSPLEEAIIRRIKDSEGKEFSLIKDVWIPLKDGTIATVESVIEAMDIASQLTTSFVNSYINEAKELFTTGDGMAILISDVSAGIEKGLAPEQIAKIVATKLVVKTTMNKIKNEFLLSESDQFLLDQGKDISELSPEGQQALSNFAVNHPIYNTAYLAAVSFATTMLLNANEGWDRQEYTMAAVEAVAQASAQTTMSIAMSKGWLGMSSSAGAGVGAAVAHIISASVRDIFADDHMNSHQWQSTVISAGIIGAAAWAGSAAAIALIGGAFAGPIGAVVATIIVSQFMGGKVYKDGQYPDPYDFINIIPKEDGTGNNIFAIEAGALLKAAEGKNDDLFGTSNSDVAIGASGNNTIMGYDGNDHIEGKGGNDILIGGSGDDLIYGGGEDDIITGNIGNDFLIGIEKGLAPEQIAKTVAI